MSDPKSPFFAPQNEAMLDRLLYNDFQRRIGGDLSTKQKDRLVKTVRHYMNEVYEELGSQPVPVLNKEVLAVVVPDYLSYLRRGQIASTEQAEDRTRMDVGNRYNQLQTERQEGRSMPPAAPDFRISIDDGASTALSLFEQVKKQREDDAMRITAAAASARPDENAQSRMRGQDLINEMVDSSVKFSDSSDAAKKRDELALVERSLMRQAAAQKQVNLSLPPDPRAFFFGNSLGPGQQQQQENSIFPQANPTLALPDAIRTRPVLPQDTIKKQDDIVSYRENEYNLFLYSSDRDWTVNNTENRYNFSVNFDPANNRTGFGFSTSTNIKFKNIVRIELVKAIIPREGIDIVPTQVSGTGYNTDLNIDALSFPYLMIRIPELDTNNFGTNNNVDNSFGIVQYDANWMADNSTNNRGYLAMIPKFMKCQKVYYPTPLSTLQKLSIQIQRPDGNLVNDDLDTLTIQLVTFSGQLSSFPPGSTVTGTLYATADNGYIWMRTTTWFSKFAFSQGDRIVIKNVAFRNSTFNNTLAATDFINYLQRSKGHVIVNLGNEVVTPFTYSITSITAVNLTSITYFVASTLGLNSGGAVTITGASSPQYNGVFTIQTVNTNVSFTVLNNVTPGSTSTASLTIYTGIYTTGANSQGYCNYIILKNNFADPTTGSTSLQYYGGSSALDTAFYTTILQGTTISAGRIINMSHQTQLVLRVITRDMDSASHLRPDNNF